MVEPLRPRTTLLACVHLPDHTIAIAAIVKRTYWFTSEAAPKLSLADEQVPIRTRAKVDRARDLLLDEHDVVGPKAMTDVVVMGSAHAPAPTRELFVAVAAGNVARQLRVVGERRALVGADGSVRFSEAESFSTLELSDALAYGGYDEHAADALMPLSSDVLSAWASKLKRREAHDPEATAVDKPTSYYAYARNPVGRGYFIDLDRTRAEGALLPQVEDPADALTPERFFLPKVEAWIDAPIPGRLGWLHPARYPRLGRIAGRLVEHAEPTRPIRESTLGGGSDLSHPGEPGSVNPLILQGASPGLACERLRGDELVILRNLHREVPELRFHLPNEMPRISIKPSGLKTLSLQAVLNTVRLEPDENRVTLTWCGILPAVSTVSREVLSSFAVDVAWARAV